ncbi:MAG TPA: hypothetical protein VL424_06015 [Pararobbsia sp.]|jgi:hypothetical protein|nr:hypothetical protein [Pararobbsia sp.]
MPDIQSKGRSDQALRSNARPALSEIILTLFAGPLVLAALMVSFVVFAFNVWPTFLRISEWGD